MDRLRLTEGLAMLRHAEQLHELADHRERRGALEDVSSLRALASRVAAHGLDEVRGAIEAPGARGSWCVPGHKALFADAVQP